MAPKKSQQKKPRNPLVGKWVPNDQLAIANWAVNMYEELKKKHKKVYEKWRKYFPRTYTAEATVAEFLDNADIIDEIRGELKLKSSVYALIKAMCTESDVCMLVTQMNDQLPITKLFGGNQKLLELYAIIDVPAFLFMLNFLLEFSPRFVEDGNPVIHIPVPLGCLLTYHMATPAGFAGFMNNTRVNELFKRILDEYGRWLMTADSTGSLTDKWGGWFSDAALAAMPDFDTTFVCNPEAPHHGYNSFDEFFRRELQPNARPVAGKNDPHIVVNACENAPFVYKSNVKAIDRFWIKKQPYSLKHILALEDNQQDILDKFVGGTVYQGFLSPHTYHRFHAPVSGKLVVNKVVEGTYFSQPYYQNEKSDYMDSQPYLGHIATRGVIIIDTGISYIGMVAFVPIGMVDVSTVDLDLIKDKTSVEKGENIGTFHFGGSSHLLIFENKANVLIDTQGITPSPDCTDFLKVNSIIATIYEKVK